MAGGEGGMSLPPADYSGGMSVEPMDGGMCVAPPPPPPPPPAPKPAAPKDNACYTPAPKAQPNMSFVEEPVCKAPAPAAPPPPPKPVYDKAKIEKRAAITEAHINNWVTAHKAVSDKDGWVMQGMDWYFASDANDEYAKEQGRLQGHFKTYQTLMAKGDLEGASKQLDFIDAQFKVEESRATKARNGVIESAEAHVTGATVVRDVAFGTVAGAGILATGGAAAPLVFGAGGGGLLGTAAVGTVIVAPGMAVLEGGADAAGAALVGGNAGQAFVDGAWRGTKDTAIAGVAVVATGGLAGVMAHSARPGVAAAGHLLHSGEHAVAHMTTTHVTKGAAVEVATYVGTETVVKKTGVAVAKKVTE